jgi:hypothetical protein
MSSYDHDPIYINLAINTGINSTPSQNLANSPSQIVFKNENAIVLDPENYYISLNRASISTLGVPMYIFPIKNGITQTNIDLSPFTMKFQYYDASKVMKYELEDSVLYISEILDSTPLPPSQNNGFQDFVNSPFYYFQYDIYSMLNIFNTNIKRIYEQFCTNLIPFGAVLDATLHPYYTWDSNSKVFSLNFPADPFDQDVYPQVNFLQDSVSGDLFNTPANVYTKTLSLSNYLMISRNLYNNNIQTNEKLYYQMYASANSVVGWVPIKRLVFTLTDIPIRRLEIDSSFDNIAFQAQNNISSISFARPNLNIFFDLLVDPDHWADNRNTVNYSVSSIAESRLVSLASGQNIKNFTISIFWVDTNAIQRPLLSIPNSCNILKLALYRKTTMLL